MMKFIQYALIGAITSSGFCVAASDAGTGVTEIPAESKSESEYQSMIEDYKAHLATVPKNVRDEIKGFRVEIAKVQKQKRDLYKKLSIEAQEYLKLEERFRQKLPVQKGKINLDLQTNISSDQTNK